MSASSAFDQVCASVPALVPVVLPPAAAAPRPAPPLRVLHLINGDIFAGAERVQDLLALRLPALGVQVGFVCLKDGKFPTARRSQDTPLFVQPMRSSFDLRPAFAIARLVREQGYDLLHTHNPRNALVGALVAHQTGVPLVHHIHSPATQDSARPWQNRRNAAVERFCLRRAARAIAVSHSLGQYLRDRGLSSNRITVVHNGVPACGPLPERPAPGPAWTLGTAALFRPRKGLEILLLALAQLRREGWPVRLRAIGGFETPAYQSQVLQLVSQLALHDAIDWVGFVQQVEPELRRLDLFVLPSLFGEGLPMVVLEAMAAGIPVIGTDVQGTPEALRHEQDGLIVPPGDAAALAGGVARFLKGELDWHALRSSAWHRHQAQFSDHAMASGVAAVYRQLVAPVATTDPARTVASAASLA